VRDEGRNDEESDGRKGTTRKYVRKEKKKKGGWSLDSEEVAQ
jgi:hypothetical protein